MMKKNYLISILTLVIVFLLLVPVRDTEAQSLDLTSFLIDTHGDALVARFSIDVSEFDKIKNALDNGSKVALVCDIGLLLDRVLIWNELISGKALEIELEKDLLSGKYNIKFPGHERSLKSFEKSDFLELFGDMNVEIMPLAELEAGQKYVVRIQAKLVSKGVPKWIKRTLFFWSWDLARSARYEMEFSL